MNRRTQHHRRTTSQRNRKLAMLACAASFTLGSHLARATDVSWDPAGNGSASGGAGTWDTSSLQWFDGVADNAWNNGNNDNANLGGSAGAITLSTGINLQNLNFLVDGYSIIDNGSGNSLTFGGSTPTINVAAGTGTIATIVAGGSGLNVVGPGTLVLSGSNTFSGNVSVSGGGTLSFAADSALGASGSNVTLNGAALSYTGAGNFTGRNITFGANGGTLDILNVGTNGSGAKMVWAAGMINSASTGPITKTGNGYIQINGSNSGYTGAGAAWTVNGGAIEVQASGNALGASSVPVTINAGGEIATKAQNIPNPITLNGGIIGNDSSSNGTFSGAINVAANSYVRLGDFFDGSNRNTFISGPISGSGTISFLNGQTFNAAGVATPSAPSGNTLVVSGDNRGFTGGIIVDGGHALDLVYSSTTFTNALLANISATSTNLALPVIAEANFDEPPPTITSPAGTTGVYAVTNFTVPGARVIDESTIGGGNWFFGAFVVPGGSNSASFFGTVKPGTDANSNYVYRLGGGGGTLFVGSTNSIPDFNPGTGKVPTNVLIGDPRINGAGTIRYGASMAYTGTTTIANGTLLLNFGANFMPKNAQVIFGTPTSNGTLDLAGLNQTVGGLSVAAGANPLLQIVQSTSNAGTLNNNAVLTVDTTAQSSTFAGVIKESTAVGTGKTLGVTVAGTNSLTFSGNNTYLGGTTINTGATLQIGAGTTSGSVVSPITNNGVLIYNRSGSVTSPVVSGTGSVIQNGPGTVVLQPANNFSGGLTINSGTVSVRTTSGAVTPLGTNAVTLAGGKLALAGQQSAGTAASAPAAIAMSGFNVDAIDASTDTATSTTGRLDTSSSGVGTFTFYQTGFNASAGGLPASGPITSAVANTVYSAHGQPGVNTPFNLQSYTSNNVLSVGAGSLASLSLTAPAAYKDLAVLATSTSGSNSDASTVVINFADGSSVTTSIPGYDWFVGAGVNDTTRSPAAAVPGLTRYSHVSNAVDAASGHVQGFDLYETDIDLTNIGGVDYSLRPIASVGVRAAFTSTTGGRMDVFAISGTNQAVNTDPSQTYSNNINVTADSGIDVSNSLNASVGALTIGSNKLALTSADATTSPYGLTFNGTTLGGDANFDVGNSAGGGAGKMDLGAVNGSGTITKNGSGRLALNNSGAVNTPSVVNGGTVEVDYTGTSPLPNIKSMLTSGYANGAWNGTGINSAAAASIASDSNNFHKTALGYAEASDVGEAETAVLVRYTYTGDANLDGSVDTSDFVKLSAHFNQAGGWAQGDFNYDGVVNALDFNAVASNFGLSIDSAPTASALGTLVPEPASLGLLALAGMTMVARRRRR